MLVRSPFPAMADNSRLPPTDAHLGDRERRLLPASGPFLVCRALRVLLSPALVDDRDGSQNCSALARPGGIRA